MERGTAAPRTAHPAKPRNWRVKSVLMPYTMLVVKALPRLLWGPGTRAAAGAVYTRPMPPPIAADLLNGLPS